MKKDSEKYFLFFLAETLGKTVSELQYEITESELVYWHAYYDIKNKEQEKQMKKVK